MRKLFYRLLAISVLFTGVGCGDDGGKLTEFDYQLQDASNRTPMEGVFAVVYQSEDYSFNSFDDNTFFVSNAKGELQGYFFSQEGTTSSVTIGALDTDDCHPQFPLSEGRISESLLRLKRPTLDFVVDFSDYAQGDNLKDLDLTLVHSSACSRALVYQDKVNVVDDQILELKIYPMGSYTFQMRGDGASSLSSILRSFTFEPSPTDSLILIEIEQ